MNKIREFLVRRKVELLVFIGAAIGLSLFSFDNILGPSRHFHFIDLAHSFVNGQVGTDTPKRIRGQKPREGDPKGYQAAIDRHTTDAGGKGVGWNDWASIREFKLTDGTWVKGVFPWGDKQGEEKKRFVELDGTRRIIDTQLDVAKDCGDPPRRCDETKYFMSFPPFPAVAMIPFYLIWGYNFNDVLFTVLNAALNALLLFTLLEYLRLRQLSRRSTRENVVLTILFTFGTVNLFSAIRGEVWFTALVLGFTLHVLYILFAIEARRPFLAGLMLGLGMATRTPIAFAFIFFALEMFRDGDRLRWPGFAYILKKGVLFAVPILAVGVALMAYNYARFENPFEFGHKFLAAGTRPSIRDHGLFSFWFLRANLAAAFINPPVIDGVAPYIHITRHGLSMLFTTPVFIFLLWPKDFGAFGRNLAIAMAFVAIPSLFYQNTGWAQFGYRFSMDFMPYMILMLAAGNRKFGKGFYVAFAISLLVNFFGAITYDRIGMFYYD